MKTQLVLASALIFALFGCDQKNPAVEDLQRKNAELQAKIEEQERAAKLKNAEDLAARQMAANDEAAGKLAADRAALEAQMAQLTAAQKAAEAERFQLKQEALKAEERRIAEARAQSARQAEEAREIARVREVRPVAERRTLDIFYDQLDPFGNWLEVEGYGYVFHPTVARDRNWRPYMDGTWLRSDQGWIWKSNEPFGWATYHYGRWSRLNKSGWVWVPGSEWAPAWVAWRSNEEYIGWAPLPPEAHSANGFNFAVDDYFDIGAGSYLFVTHRNFTGGNTYVGRCVDPERNGRIVAETENVTDVTYRQVNQQMVIVNEGPVLTTAGGAGAAPSPTYRVRRIEAGSPHEHPTATAAGVLSIFAPALLHQLQTKPRQVTSREPYEVNRGWKELPPDMQAQIRERNAVEARNLEERQRSGAIAIPAPPAPRTAPRSPAAPPMEVRHGDPKPGVAPNEPGGLRQRPPAPAAVVTPSAPVPAPTIAPPPVEKPERKKPEAAPGLKPPIAPTPPVPAPAVSPAPVIEPERKKPEVVPGVKPPIAPPVPAPAPTASPASVIKPERKKPEVVPVAPTVKPDSTPAIIPPVSTPVPTAPPAPVTTPKPAPAVPPPVQVPAKDVPIAPISKPAPMPAVVVPVPVPANPSAPLTISEPKPVIVRPAPRPEPVIPPSPVIKPEPKAPQIVPVAPVVAPAPKPAIVPAVPMPAPAAPPAPIIKPEPKPAVIPPAPLKVPDSKPTIIPVVPVPTPPPVNGGVRKPGAP